MPGFPATCPVWYDCSLDIWQTTGAILMHVVIAEALLLALVAILARRGRRMLAGGPAAPLLVALCALLAIAGVVWLSRFTAHVFYAPFVHVTLKLVTAERRKYADMLNHVFVPLGVIAFAFVLGTATTAATLIRTAVNGRLLPLR